MNSFMTFFNSLKSYLDFRDLSFKIKKSIFLLVENKLNETEKVKGMNKEVKKYNNIYFPDFVKNLDNTKSINVRNTDTFVIGHQKSGTTWVEEIVWLIKNNLNYEKAKKEFHFERCLYADMGIPNIVFEFCPSPRIFKSHLKLEFLPKGVEKKAKIVYVMRNPKDVVVSMFKFLESINGNEFNGKFEDLVDIYIEGKSYFGCWCSHVDSYVNLPEIFVIVYENLLENPLEITKKLSEFLGKNYTDDQIRELIAFCSFDKMKNYDSFDKRFFVQSEIFNENINFFRKGKIGNWRDYFNDDLSKKFDDYIKQNLKSDIQIQYLPTME